MAQTNVTPPTTLGPGVRIQFLTNAFTGTQNTTDFVVAFAGVFEAIPVAYGSNRADDFAISNTRNTDGGYALIAGTGGNVIRVSRNGTQSQSIGLVVFGR